MAVVSHTATGRRSNRVEHAAAELAAALVALREEPARHDLRQGRNAAAVTDDITGR